MGHPAAPTLLRILLVCALVAWFALATAVGFTSVSVWSGVLVGIGALAAIEAVGRKKTSELRNAARTPGTPPRSPHLEALLAKLPEPPVALPPLVPPGPNLLDPFSPLPPPRELMPALVSRIDFPSSDPRKGFARLVPFDDGRELIVRRGEAMGHSYGMEQGRRLVAIAGHHFLVVNFMQLLSPPVLRPGEAPMSPEAARAYKPEWDVLYLPDAEVLLNREPRGFSDAEVARILAGISFETPSESPEVAAARLRARASTSHELKQAIYVVGANPTGDAASLLRAYLRNTDLTVVEAACHALARIGAREAIADLIDLLRPEAATERNIDCFTDPFGWPEAPPRASALSALTTLRVVEAEPAVRSLLSDADTEVQRLARKYLEVIGRTQ